MFIEQILLLMAIVMMCSANPRRYQFYPYYHLAPPYGWMNEPSGFCKYKDEYHIFYQYNPMSSKDPGTFHWGHAKSANLFNWVHLPVAIYPDQDYDKSGVFSGSAIVQNEKMYVLYTANVHNLLGNPDHTQRQALAISGDAINFTKYTGNPVIMGEDHQPNFRDPKVWKYGNSFYAVIGNSLNDTFGRVIMYTSKDLYSWKEVSVILESDGAMGYMWEYPDFFEINGKWILLFSPQGLQLQGDKYMNLFQTGYIVGDFDYETHLFTPQTEFRELDCGHDFYATQTMLGTSGRRIVVAWFDMSEQSYPEHNDGWTGHLTIPRVLYLTADYKLIQKPVMETVGIRENLLYSGIATAKSPMSLPINAAEIIIKASKVQDFVLTLEGGNATMTISYEYMKGQVSLDRGGADGRRRTKWRPSGKTDLQMQLFVDKSSLELFCGDGEVTFSSRFFPTSEINIKLGNNSQAYEFTVYSMKRTIPLP